MKSQNNWSLVFLKLTLDILELLTKSLKNSALNKLKNVSAATVYSLEKSALKTGLFIDKQKYENQKYIINFFA